VDPTKKIELGRGMAIHDRCQGNEAHESRLFPRHPKESSS
jgi:hypothetical protein